MPSISASRTKDQRNALHKEKMQRKDVKREELHCAIAGAILEYRRTGKILRKGEYYPVLAKYGYPVRQSIVSRN